MRHFIRNRSRGFTLVEIAIVLAIASLLIAAGIGLSAAVIDNARARATRQAMDTTAKLSAFVIFILVGSNVFTLIFNTVQGDKWVEHLLSGLPGGVIGFLIVVNLAVDALYAILDPRIRY